MQKLVRVLLPSAVTAVTAFCPAWSQQSVVTLDQSKLYVSPDNQVQNFSQTINLPKGQDKLQLTLTYYNGTATQPGFKWLRISSSTMSYLTEQQFDGQKSLSVDVTGDLGWGGNQLLIQAGGPKGAAFGWKLTTVRPKVTSVYPNTVEPGGTLTIKGTNFCSDPGGDVVTIGGQTAQCLSGNAQIIVVKVPDGLKTGNTEGQVKVGGLDAGTITLGINAAPILTGLSATYSPPGMPITIYGENLSPTPSNIKVQIGPFPCDINSATVNSITVTAPTGFAGAPWGINQPVKVWIGGILSSSRLRVSVYDQIGTAL